MTRAPLAVRLGRDVLLARNVSISDPSHADGDVNRPARTQDVRPVRVVRTFEPREPASVPA